MWCSASRPAQSRMPARQSNIAAGKSSPASALSYVAEDERAHQPEPAPNDRRRRSRPAGVAEETAQVIDLETMLDSLLSVPSAVTAMTAKYQVPDCRSSKTK